MTCKEHHQNGEDARLFPTELFGSDGFWSHLAGRLLQLAAEISGFAGKAQTGASESAGISKAFVATNISDLVQPTDMKSV